MREELVRQGVERRLSDPQALQVRDREERRAAGAQRDDIARPFGHAEECGLSDDLRRPDQVQCELTPSGSAHVNGRDTALHDDQVRQRLAPPSQVIAGAKAAQEREGRDRVGRSRWEAVEGPELREWSGAPRGAREGVAGRGSGHGRSARRRLGPVFVTVCSGQSWRNGPTSGSDTRPRSRRNLAG